MTPTPPLLSGNTRGTGDYFKTVSPPPREADALDQAVANKMREVAGSKTETLVTSEKDARSKKTDDNDADLLFKLDLDG